MKILIFLINLFIWIVISLTVHNQYSLRLKEIFSLVTWIKLNIRTQDRSSRVPSIFLVLCYGHLRTSTRIWSMLKCPLKCSWQYTAWDLMTRPIPLPQRSLNSSILLWARTLRDKESDITPVSWYCSSVWSLHVALTYQNRDDLWLAAGTFSWCLHSSIWSCLITGALLQFLSHAYLKEEREAQSVTLPGQ
jgi:hypothetical protein